MQHSMQHWHTFWWSNCGVQETGRLARWNRRIQSIFAPLRRPDTSAVPVPEHQAAILSKVAHAPDVEQTAEMVERDGAIECSWS